MVSTSSTLMITVCRRIRADARVLLVWAAYQKWQDFPMTHKGKMKPREGKALAQNHTDGE